MLSIVVVNWNSGTQLRECLDSIESSGALAIGEVVVIDNLSSDESLALVEDRHQVRVIRAEQNLGFAAACNLAVKQCHGDLLLFLNPDAVANLDALSRCVDSLLSGEHGKIGVVGVQLFDASGHISQSCARFPTPWRFLAQSFGLDRVFPRLGVNMADWDHSETRQVDHVIGAFYMVRREVFEILHGFDERFFLYLEDLDFSLRAHQAGWQTVYLAEARAFHAGGGTSKQIKSRRLFYSLRSRLLYVFKHFSLPGALLVSSVTLLVEPFTRSLFVVSTGSWAGLRETWSAYLMLWRWLPRWVFKGEAR
jgi:GT2 family glycosyltransferase